MQSNAQGAIWLQATPIDHPFNPTRNTQTFMNHILLFLISRGRHFQVKAEFLDMDASRIYAMKRPAFQFFMEVWSRAECPSELLASEYLNAASSPEMPDDVEFY